MSWQKLAMAGWCWTHWWWDGGHAGSATQALWHISTLEPVHAARWLAQPRSMQARAAATAEHHLRFCASVCAGALWPAEPLSPAPGDVRDRRKVEKVKKKCVEQELFRPIIILIKQPCHKKKSNATNEPIIFKEQREPREKSSECAEKTRQLFPTLGEQ